MFYQMILIFFFEIDIVVEIYNLFLYYIHLKKYIALTYQYLGKSYGASKSTKYYRNIEFDETSKATTEKFHKNSINH